LLLQRERRVEHALQVRIAYADFVHVLERVADVLDAGAALADALGDQASPAVQVELAHIGRMLRVGEEGERTHGPAIEQPGADQLRSIGMPRHLATP